MAAGPCEQFAHTYVYVYMFTATGSGCSTGPPLYDSQKFTLQWTYTIRASMYTLRVAPSQQLRPAVDRPLSSHAACTADTVRQFPLAVLNLTRVGYLTVILLLTAY